MSYDYNDGPECYDPIFSAFRRGCEPEACSSGITKPPRITKWYKNVKLLDMLPKEERKHITDYFREIERCPVCKQSIFIEGILISHCAVNDQYSWFCDQCQEWLYHFNWPCWHKIPAWKRDDKSSDTEYELYDCISSRNGSNINQLKDILGWSYGKTRGAAMRLQAQNLITIEEVHNQNYRELVISLNEDYT